MHAVLRTRPDCTRLHDNIYLSTKIRNLPSNCNKEKRRIKRNIHWTDKKRI